MSRSVGTFVALVLSLAAAPAGAQSIADDADAHHELVSLQHGAESVSSGLADVQRQLMLLGVRSIDEIGAARLVLTFEDHFVALAPVSASFALDGARLYASSDPAQIENGAIYSGPVPSGTHVLTLDLRYRGELLYTTSYRIDITSSYAFATPFGRTTHVRVIGHDRDLFAAPPDRWRVDFVTEADPAER